MRGTNVTVRARARKQRETLGDQIMRLVVAGTPKSGNTWLRTLLAETYNLSEVSIETIEHEEDAICQEHIAPSDAHLRWLAAKGIKPVTIFRHPVDVLVSMYHYIWMKVDRDVLPEELAILRDAERIGSGTLEYAQANLYPQLMVSELWRLAGAPFVRFEDLIADPIQTMRQLTLSLKPAEDCALRRGVLLSRFSLKRDTFEPAENTREGTNFYRRGGTGYRSELTPEIMSFLGTAPFLEHMTDLGYQLYMDPIEPFDVTSIDPFRGHDAFANGVRISSYLHALLMHLPDLISWPRPWEVSAADNLFTWLNTPEEPGAQLTNLMRLVYSRRPDLREAYPDVDRSPRDFQLWFLMNASKEYQLGPEFLTPVRAFLQTARSEAAAPSRGHAVSQAGSGVADPLPPGLATP